MASNVADGAVTIHFVPFNIYVLTETALSMGTTSIGFSLKYTQVSSVTYESDDLSLYYEQGAVVERVVFKWS